MEGQFGHDVSTLSYRTGKLIQLTPVHRLAAAAVVLITLVTGVVTTAQAGADRAGTKGIGRG